MIWLNSNHEDLKPDFYIIQEKTKEKPDIKIYIENPVFRNDYTIESAKLSQKIIDDEISYTDYKPKYDKNGNIEESKLHRVTKLNIDRIKINSQVQEIKKEINNLYAIDTENFNERKKLKEEEKQLNIKLYEIQKQQRGRRFTPKFQSLLNFYENFNKEKKDNKNNLSELIDKINKDKEILQNKAKELEEITNKNMIKIRELQSKLADIISYDKVYYDYKYGKENLVFSTKIYGKINSRLEFQRRDLINDD